MFVCLFCPPAAASPFSGARSRRRGLAGRSTGRKVAQRLVVYYPTTSASTAPCISRRSCCPTQCASYCAPCQPLRRAFSGWIRSPLPTVKWHSQMDSKQSQMWTSTSFTAVFTSLRPESSPTTPGIMRVEAPCNVGQKNKCLSSNGHS